MTSAVIVAAGKSERMGEGVDKAFFILGSKPVLAYSLRVMEQCPEVNEVVLVVRRDQILGARQVVRIFGCKKVSKIVAGGASRHASVAAGLAACDPEADIICVHDGARPCVTAQLVSETVRSAVVRGSGVAASKITDTVKRVDKGRVVTETVDREDLWTVQTPQTFRAALLRRAFGRGAGAAKHTDEASAVEALGESVHIVPADAPNIKITIPGDIQTASRLLGIQ